MFGKVFRIKSTAALGKHVAIEGILNIDTTLGGYLYINGSQLSGTEVAFLDGITAGSSLASKALVVDAYEALRIGDWAAAGASTNCVVFSANHNYYSDGQLGLLSIFGASTSNLTTAYNAHCARFRHLVSGSSITVAQETYGALGQVCAKGSTMTHLHGGLMGTFEGTGAAVVLNSSYTTGGHACVMARPGGHANITCTTPLFGFLAFNNASAAVASGVLAAFGTSVVSTSYPWPYGLYIQAGTATIGAMIGKFGSSAATTSAIPFSTAQDVWSDGQLSTVEAHGSSASDLTSAYCAKVGRFRHIVNASSGSVAHETYGFMGQLVVKATTLTHLHSGIIGTFEGHTSGVVLNSSYTTGGHAAVMARIGGHAAITCTTPLFGFLAWNNASAAVAGGTLAAFGTAVASASYQWPYGLYIGAGTATLPIYANSSVMGATGRVAQFYGTCTNAALTDGYGAVEIDLTLAGTNTDHVAASSSWVNITTGTATAGTYICARNDGIYEVTAATVTNAKLIFGARMQYIVEDTDGLRFPWSINTNNAAITALIDVNNFTDLGLVTNAGSDAGTLIPIARDAGGTLKYVKVYDLA